MSVTNDFRHRFYLLISSATILAALCILLFAYGHHTAIREGLLFAILFVGGATTTFARHLKNGFPRKSR